MFNFTKAFACLSVLAAVSQTISASDIRIQRRQGKGAPDPAHDIPADAKNLPIDCQDILYNAGVTAAWKASKDYTNEYFVSLKFSATAKDVNEVLALPILKGVKPNQIYTHDYDRGFSAKLSYEQVCAVDKEARVGSVQICEGSTCAAEKPGAAVVPAPSKNSGVKGAPDISGLSDQCAKVVWYTVLEYPPETIDPGKYVAITKIWVTPKDAEAFFSKQAGLIRNRPAEADGFYAGKWTYAQLCEIEKSPLVSRVETMELPGAPPNGAPKGGKGKGSKI